MIADLKLSRSKLPLDSPIQSWSVNTSWDINRLRFFLNGFQRSLNTIVNGFHQTRTQFYRQRLTCSQNRVTDRKACSFFVNLDGGLVTVNSNDFTHQVIVTDLDQFVHGTTNHIFSNDDRTRDRIDGTIFRFSMVF